MTLLVSEVFGPTVQGEGPSLGRRCGFVRLGLCNLDCLWCDTPYTWDWTGKNGIPQDRSALVHTDPDDLNGAIGAMDVEMVVVSGGEPLLQRRGLEEWLATVPRTWRVEVETNGTRFPGSKLECRVDGWNVSPKLPHSGVPLRKAWLAGPMAGWADLAGLGRAAFKVVCVNAADVELVQLLADEHRLPLGSVWVMPEGTDPAAVNAHGAAIAEAAIAAGFNVTTRLHVQLWGNERRR